MSIASDIRSYADNAVNQGRGVLDQSRAAASAQFTEVTDQANDFYGKTRGNVSDIAAKANDAVADLRTSAEKVVPVDAIKSAVEPYVAQARTYTDSVSDRAESLFAGVASDKRVQKLVSTANNVGGIVAGTVQERVVKPVQTLTGRKPARRSSTRKTTTRSAATRPAATRPAATRPATKATASTSTTAKKAPAKKATSSRTATKATATKAAATKATAKKASTPRKSTARKTSSTTGRSTTASASSNGTAPTSSS